MAACLPCLINSRTASRKPVPSLIVRLELALLDFCPLSAVDGYLGRGPMCVRAWCVRGWRCCRSYRFGCGAEKISDVHRNKRLKKGRLRVCVNNYYYATDSQMQLNPYAS